LLNIGVTHLLNTAENDVNINPKRYQKEGICYKGFRCPDLPQSDIAQFFDESVEFIDRALSFSCGKIFVNCLLVSCYFNKKYLKYLKKKKKIKKKPDFLRIF
jgi:hypothetical protein